MVWRVAWRCAAAAACAIGCWTAPALAKPPALPNPPTCRPLANQAPEAFLSACDKAIEDEQDGKSKAVLLLRRAYARNDAGRFALALTDLDEAVRLDGENWAALHERGYTLNSLGRYRDAVAALDAAARISPDDAAIYQERAYAKFLAADFDGAIGDWTKKMSLSPATAGDHWARGRAHLWLGHYAEATAEFDAGLELARKANDATATADLETMKKLADLWRKTSPGEAPEKGCALKEMADVDTAGRLAGDCTAAFFKRKTGKARAEALTVRSVALVVAMQDPKAGTTDRQIAAALDPANADMQANLGYAYVEAGKPLAAVTAFDRAIAIKPSAFAYAGRASARYALKDFGAAEADAKKSVDTQPNEIALMLLGDLALETRADETAAKAYWMAAYRLGSRDDRLIARLTRVGVADPDKEPKE
jgi:tetratricopeptide (TPR) repeat protein